MNDSVDSTAVELARRLRDSMGASIKEVILFGSRARGDTREGSDYDVLIVVEGERLRRKQRMRIANEAVKIGVELGVDADVLVMTETEKAERVNKPYTVTYWAFQEGARL